MANDPLVTTDWLAEHLHDSDLRVVDMRGYVTTKPVAPGIEEATYRGAFEEYLGGHIPGAVYVDWTRDIVDPADPVPAQIAPPELFAEAMSVRGIGDATKVVAVDHMGGQFATRLWWALMYYGHDDVFVLDGGYHRWIEEGRELEPGTVSPPRAQFTTRVRPEMRVTADSLFAILGDPCVQILDARDSGQYLGTRRRGLRGGHIPRAINVPRELFFAEGGGFLPLPVIQKRLDAHGVDRTQPTVAYCNGGVAATVPLFHMYRLNYPLLANYDGSWNEWGNREDLPVATADETRRTAE